MENLKKTLKPLVKALDTFIREAPHVTTSAPHIRDAVDLKRWMFLVVLSLVPCMLMAIWNTGVQSFVYASQDIDVALSYFKASTSLHTYLIFCKAHYISILKLGTKAFIPIIFLCYLTGGFWETLFASIRGHEISEGFLVTGALIALILPSTIPYWMVVVGTSVGVVLGKEIFGGTGMNILNPALVARCFLFFSFPAKMTGSVWVGTNPTHMQANLLSLNEKAKALHVDGISEASPLQVFNISSDIKRIHIDAIGAYFHKPCDSLDLILSQFKSWSAKHPISQTFQDLSLDQLQSFLITPISSGGLGLSPENFFNALEFAKLKFSIGLFSASNFFFGNMIGSMGETSKLAILLGALLLITVGIASFRTMIAMFLGSLFTLMCFKYGSMMIGSQGGLWNPAAFDFPITKHFLMGGLLFGLVFMATEPVSSPKCPLAKWIYGFFIGGVVIVIRLLNPAFPEGVMLAILLGNVLTPLLDHYALTFERKRHRERARKILQQL